MACDCQLSADSEIQVECYSTQLKQWPQFGKHILAQYNDNRVIVYQAFNPVIANYAVANQRFGGPEYKMDRMTWIKPNFLWMMYRSGWASKKNQERILAIHLTREGFEEILRKAYTVNREREENVERAAVNVRLQWDPDHDPMGQSVARRAIQLGLKHNVKERFINEFTVKIEDITSFVHEQHKFVESGELEKLLTPTERVYVPQDPTIPKLIELDSQE